MALPSGYKFKGISAAKKSQALEAGVLGRQANTRLAIQRRETYNKSPNLCAQCHKPILVSAKESLYWVKKKRFCNQSCGARYNNLVLGLPRHKPKIRTCSMCRAAYTYSAVRSNRCIECRPLPRESTLSARKKSGCRIQEIRTHARLVLFRARERKCEICGYSVRVDCCHIKAVKEFSKDTLLSEINKLENLKALCPNHHVELDLGLLKVSIGV